MIARHLDGASDFMENASALSTFVSAGAVTISMWYRPAGSPLTGSNEEDVDALFGDTDGFIGLFRGNVNSRGDQINAMVYDGSRKVVSASVTVGQWDHWALTSNGTTLTLFKNGNAVGTAACGNIGGLTAPIRVGRNFANAFLEGDITRLATWSAALSATEIAQLAGGIAPATVHAANLTGDWRLAGATSPEPDLAAGNHPLTLTGTSAATDPPLSGFYPIQRVITADVNNADSSSASFAFTPTAGNLVVVEIFGWRAAGSGGFDMPVGGVTDNQGNPSYTRAVQSALASDGASRVSIFYVYNIAASGTFTVTVDPTGSGNYFSWVMTEVNGATTADPLDKTASNTGSSTAPSTGATAALSQADEIAYSVVSFPDTATVTVESVSPNWDLIFEEENAAEGQPGAIHRRIVAATTAQSTAWTLGTTSTWAACIATFKADTGNPPQLFTPRVNVLLRL